MSEVLRIGPVYEVAIPSRPTIISQYPRKRFVKESSKHGISLLPESSVANASWILQPGKLGDIRVGTEAEQKGADTDGNVAWADGRRKMSVIS